MSLTPSQSRWRKLRGAVKAAGAFSGALSREETTAAARSLFAEVISQQDPSGRGISSLIRVAGRPKKRAGRKANGVFLSARTRPISWTR